MDMREDGKIAAQQFLGASVNYSPEFNATEPNIHLLQQMAETSGGKMLPFQPATPEDNPFLHDRKKTFQPHDLWQWLLQLAICLFPLDVGVRRIQLDRDEWLRATLLGAAFDAGDADKAEELADDVETEDPALWKLKTTLDDAAVSAGNVADAAVRDRLLAVIGRLRTYETSGDGAVTA